ncbi:MULTISPECIES: DUF4214 domain-containing protein [unclassified Chelatococcus]|uniref:DUF4214 domain-containing protein n=1 Tax=unclassified Chelatococcus TaxID=2638111 RepID=UPI001BCBE415|nr:MULTISPECIES: DUF4214 domain-containing protein [unclassified Chelatococcus]MBS7696781.1 DUF4214 domain-containing protein [Chelatococcus sp. YT9]MBX3555346.1 DUF4214 domain-containing protein [Chelatococcus sp.]
MALDPAVVAANYKAILRVTPTQSQVNALAGSYDTVQELQDVLITAARGSVNPVVQLYQAVFGRVPDSAGLDFWVQNYTQANVGGTLTLGNLSTAFAVSQEFQDQYDNLPDAAVVAKMYVNVLGREGEPAGVQFWTAALGQWTQEVGREEALARLVLSFSQSPEFTDAAQEYIAGFLEAAADGEPVYTGTLFNPDFLPPEPQPEPETIPLTSGVDILNIHDGDVVRGGTGTLTAGDIITGNSGSVELEFTSGGYDGQTIKNVDLITVGTSDAAGTGPVTVDTRRWTEIDAIALDTLRVDTKLSNLQSSDTVYSIDDDVSSNGLLHTTLDFDAQAVGAGKVVKLGLKEVRGDVELTADAGAKIETVALTINDTAGFTSDVNSFHSQGTTKLTIDGGTAGLDFRIKNALDAGLTSIDASAAKSNLSLNISDSTTDINVKLGAGNDKLYTGDTLSNGDVFDGNGGNDTLYATFTTGGTRAPTSTEIETFDLTFKANATLNFAKVDDVKTVNVNESSNRFALINMDSTVANLNVFGTQANAYHLIEYAPGVSDSNLKVTWANNKANDDAGALGVKRAGEFHFESKGQFDTYFNNQQPDLSGDAWQFDITDAAHPVTRVLTVENSGKGDLILGYKGAYPQWAGGDYSDSYYYMGGFADIGGTNAVTDMSFETKDTGDIMLRDIRNVDALERFDAHATASGDIYINSVGVGLALGFQNPPPFDAARYLDEIHLSSAQGSTTNVNLINALGDLSSPVLSNGATISEITLSAENDSETNLWYLGAGDVEKTTITIANGGSVGVGTWILANNLSEGSSLGTLTASGAGIFEEGDWQESDRGDGGHWFTFANQAIKNQDYSGLTEDTVHVDFFNDKGGVNFIGTDNDVEDYASISDVSQSFVSLGPVGNDHVDGSQPENFYNFNNEGADGFGDNDDHIGQVTGDWIKAGSGNDNIDAGGGNDFVFTGAGNNVVDAGAGNDYIVTATTGKNSITLGAGNDWVYLNNVGQTNSGGQTVSHNVITDFNYDGNDKIVIDISAMNNYLPGDLVNTHGDVVGSAFDTEDYIQADFLTLDNVLSNLGSLVSTPSFIDVTGTFANHNAVASALNIGSMQAIIADNDVDVGDAFLIGWRDTGGDFHISLAQVATESAGPVTAYNFNIVDVVELTGVTGISQDDLVFTG